MVRRILRYCSLALMICAAGAAAAGSLSHFPSPHQPWTTREYVDFYFAHYNGNRALPHLRDVDTSLLFRRVVNRENVARIVQSNAPWRRKQLDVATILATMGEVRGAYGYAVFVGEPLQEELAQIQAFILFLIDTAVKLDATGSGPSGRSAWKTAVWNALASLAERDSYSTEQIAFLSAALNAHYPQISSILTGSDKKEFCARIATIAAAERDAVTREAHLSLLRTASKY